MMNRQYKVCSLFSGSGGIDFAFEQVGCQIVWANENDKDACKTYQLNFPEVTLDSRDIGFVPAESIPDFDILVGGFPCQPFSILGKEKGLADERGNLFFEICRIIDEKRPRALFLENVASLKTHDKGNTFRIIREQLASRGYNLKYLIADAQDYGFPQRRNRIYIVGFQDSSIAERFFFPQKSRLEKHIFDIIDKTNKAPERCYLKPGTKQYERMNIAIEDEDKLYRFSDDHLAAKNGILSSKKGVAFTLLAGMGNWHDREPIIKDNYGIRKLTPYECFMLQGYPKSFLLKDIPIRSAYRQAGNTVCVPVVRQIAEQIVKAMRPLQPESTLVEHANSKSIVIVGTVKNNQQVAACLRYKFYHYPIESVRDTAPEPQYVALYIPHRLSGKETGIKYVGKIVSRKIVKRNEIMEIPKKSEKQYYKLMVDKWMEYNGTYKPMMNRAVCILELSKSNVILNNLRCGTNME